MTLHTIQDINDTFRTFYKHLYSNEKDPKIKDTNSFFNNLILPQFNLNPNKTIRWIHIRNWT